MERIFQNISWLFLFLLSFSKDSFATTSGRSISKLCTFCTNQYELPSKLAIQPFNALTRFDLYCDASWLHYPAERKPFAAWENTPGASRSLLLRSLNEKRSQCFEELKVPRQQNSMQFNEAKINCHAPRPLGDCSDVTLMLDVWCFVKSFSSNQCIFHNALHRNLPTPLIHHRFLHRRIIVARICGVENCCKRQHPSTFPCPPHPLSPLPKHQSCATYRTSAFSLCIVLSAFLTRAILRKKCHLRNSTTSCTRTHTHASTNRSHPKWRRTTLAMPAFFATHWRNDWTKVPNKRLG